MTSRQAKHNAKRRSEGAVIIAVTFRVDEPEAAQWEYYSNLCGGRKEALKWLFALARMAK